MAAAHSAGRLRRLCAFRTGRHDHCRTSGNSTCMHGGDRQGFIGQCVYFLVGGRMEMRMTTEDEEQIVPSTGLRSFGFSCIIEKHKTQRKVYFQSYCTVGHPRTLRPIRILLRGRHNIQISTNKLILYVCRIQIDQTLPDRHIGRCCSVLAYTPSKSADNLVRPLQCNNATSA